MEKKLPHLVDFTNPNCLKGMSKYMQIWISCFIVESYGQENPFGLQGPNLKIRNDKLHPLFFLSCIIFMDK
jgi:hypothetical protein